mmetsp:Transcript_42440/g.113544  ORF Transcript_42440/g.113544 Transcript_42440/m.113544 type:complete len:298 (+) Transcript_42440:81-974(+)
MATAICAEVEGAINSERCGKSMRAKRDVSSPTHVSPRTRNEECTNRPVDPSDEKRSQLVNQVYNHIAKYARPDDKAAIFYMSSSLALYVTLFLGAAFYRGQYESLIRTILVLICGITRTRMFVIMHDMAHHSFFTSQRMNAVCATLIGALVWTPYSGWKRGHDYHHRHSNNTDRKQWAQTAPLTVDQFRALPWWGQWIYRFAYGPITLCTTTPWIYFVILQRYMSKWYENLLVVVYWSAIFCGDIWLVPQITGETGAWRLVVTDFWTTAIGASLGLFLFHIQHSFEGAYKVPATNLA